MFLFLRILHIVTGVFWAGALFFMVSFLLPAFREVGPDGAKVFASLRSRRMFNWVPTIATITILSGFWLYTIRMDTGTGWVRSREAMTIGTGAVAALFALLLGWFVMRANTLKADDISRAAGPAPAGPERDARMAEAQKLRAGSMMAGRTVATLLLISVICMAIARYI